MYVSEIQRPGGRYALTALTSAIIQKMLCVIPLQAPGSACFTRLSTSNHRLRCGIYGRGAQ